MNDRWLDEDAGAAIRRWGDVHGKDLALRLYTARLIGADPSLVLHGGGNVSLKGRTKTLLGDEIDVLFVKESGGDLATIEPAGMPGLDLSMLRRYRTLTSLGDEDMTRAVRSCLLDPSSPTPSIETFVHAFLPHQYVDHSHADAVLAVTNHANGRALSLEAMGERVAVIDYVRPGYELALAVAAAIEAHPEVVGLVLLHHGLITFGPDARTAYGRHVRLVSACEEFLTSRTRVAQPGMSTGASASSGGRSSVDTDVAGERVVRVAPILRGLLARRTGDEDQPYDRPILEWRGGAEILALAKSDAAGELATGGPLTGDHLIRTKPRMMFIADPNWSDDNALRTQLTDAVDEFRRDYASYVRRHGDLPDRCDMAPRVVLLPGAGLLAWGSTKRAARVAADIAEHTLTTKARAAALGDYTPLSEDHLFDMEFRSQQQRKTGVAPTGVLAGQIVIISGAAGAIGSSVAEVCAEAGAHVVLSDVNEERLSSVTKRLAQRFGDDVVMSVVADVTDEDSVRVAYENAVRHFGGVDVIVPNAGVAHVAAVAELDVSDFRRVMEINATGYLLFMQQGIAVLKRQGLGGHIVINASKNVFGPGKEFGAYSASKAAAHQLGKVAAIELAADQIRVNMINADAIFGDERTPSGLWASVGPKRAKVRGITEAELPEYYRGRNLLHARVTGRHVGNAVVFFASNATPTTGATLPVDGGVVDAFPR